MYYMWKEFFTLDSLIEHNKFNKFVNDTLRKITTDINNVQTDLSDLVIELENQFSNIRTKYRFSKYINKTGYTIIL